MSEPRPNPLAPAALKTIGATPERAALVLGPNHEKALAEAQARAGAPKPDVFYRLTTATGPAALEELKVLDGKVVSRRVVEEKNMRAIILDRLMTLNDGAG